MGDGSMTRAPQAKTIAIQASCGHGALEIDEIDEVDEVDDWRSSAYTNDLLSMRIGTGEVTRFDAHVTRSESIASATYRVEDTYGVDARKAVLQSHARPAVGASR